LNEEERLESLRRYDILDTEPEEAFDDFTKLASFICGMPISMISLVDENRQWFKSVSGWNKKETPRDEAFCAHAILEDDLFIVPDATQDTRFHDNPLVVENPKIKFYAGAPLVDPEGNKIGTLCLMDKVKHELTNEQKGAMKILSCQVMAQLELRLRNKELNKLMEQLKRTQHQLIIQEKMASLGQLTTGIAHEIKNPLNFINNFASLSRELLNEFSESLITWDSKVGKDEFIIAKDTLTDITTNISRIEDHGKRANNIVNSLLSHAPRSKGEFIKSNLNQILMENVKLALDEYKLRVRDFNITVKYNLDEKLESVDLIPQEFNRVIKNIIDNSCFAVEKKYNLRVNIEPVITVSTEKQNGFARIGIRDNGIGIKEEILKNIFTPFFTTKSPGEGTGLGLSISYDIVVKYHNGKIEVHSIEGEYTEFSILIPTSQLIK
jgi:two-component system, NtrC family, sensor kinase